jgi:hypothetical protein
LTRTGGTLNFLGTALGTTVDTKNEIPFATNPYIGITSISAGPLVLNGDQTAATGNVSVSGTLAGLSVNTTINSNGHFAAGDGTAL